jgi:hypothetical protein
MGQITFEERRLIRLNKQRASLELIRQLSAPLPTSKPLATRSRFRRVREIALIAVLLTAGWFLSHVVELHPPRSIADMAPRLDASYEHETDR